jgi:predicted O-linked N-acetylglucosamine transferase (SPINDLY family)
MTPWGVSDVDPVLRWVAESLAAGEIEAALQALAPVVSASAPPIAARFVLGMLAWRIGRLDWALDLMRQCHEQDPMDGAVAEALASLLAQSGDLVECIYAAKLATTLKDKGALADLVPSDFPSFERAFRSIDERPKLAEAQRARAAGQLEEALECARQHVAISKHDVEGRSCYARLLLEAGRAGDAVDALHLAENAAATDASLASLSARCLSACGEHDAARHWHDVATRLDPESAAIEAARVADGPWLDDAAAAIERGAAWARRFVPLQKPRAVARREEGPLVIAYLVTALPDTDDGAAVAAVARAHDRSRIKVLAYAAGAQSWPANRRLCGAFDRWQDVGSLDGSTIARYVARDAVDVVIDASGFSSPDGLQALARITTALRVSWLGNYAGLLAPFFDARIGDGDWEIVGGYPTPEARRSHDYARTAVQFGADIVLPQLDSETVALWSVVLDSSPHARLLLRARDMSAGAIDRLVKRFGRDRAARIDIVAADGFGEFWRRADLALLPRRGLSPRSAAEALACGVPTIAFADSIYGAFLRQCGCARPAADGDEYVHQARAAAAAPIAPTSRPAEAAAFAAAIEARARRTLAFGAAA